MNGIILAKEKSQRLSCNKALIEIEGEALIERLIKIIKPYCKDILIISNDERLSQFGKRFCDIYKEKGPISGLYTGLYYSDCERSLILASDMPFLEKNLIEHINIEGNFQAIIPTIDGIPEPLCAIYSKEIIPLIKEQIENSELSLNSLIKRLNATYIDCNKFRDCFFNLNTQEDLNSFQNGL
ncbi:MAG: molybdenum cofactor guanylyltransferase [bacterium]